MALTVGLTSMDKATETALRAAFDAANSELQGRFQLVEETAADYVIIDMDSMYGPMGWLRLHAAGKQVIGLTSALRTQADFRLGRPFDTVAMIGLLRDIAAHAGVDLAALAETAPAAAVSIAAAEPSPLGGEVAPPTTPPAAEPAEPAPPPLVADIAPDPTPAPPSQPGGPAEAAVEKPAAETTPDATAPSAGSVATLLQPAPPPAERRLLDWLRSGELRGRLRLQCAGSPALWLDADQATYVGPAQLKPLDACFDVPLRYEDFEPLDDAAWNAGVAGGEPRPLTRLTWYGGLLAGDGALMPGFDPDARYQLLKWPQTEREFPRHFRIATAMMKGPATLAEIAEASGSPLPEVADFVNANLATGFAEPWVEPQPEAPPSARQGLFSRFIRK